MVVVSKVFSKSIFDSRKDKTILVSIETNVGVFSASSPTGKSTGKFESTPYRKNLDGDIETLNKFSDYFSEENIDNFSDLRRVEDTVDRHIGANSLFALESAILKALASEQKKEIWELINPRAKKFPRFVGNAIGGGKHSQGKKKPDFQEFLLIPDEKSVKKSQEKNKDAKKELSRLLKKKDDKFSDKKSDEDAWETSLNDKEIFDVLRETGIPLGTDVASSGFFKRRKYHYENPMFKRTEEEQLIYISNLIRNFNLFYVEDPFDENDFESFAQLLKKFPKTLIVGDDLIVTNYKRLGKAIKEKSVNAIIIKPNQTGSLMEVQRVCELAKKNGIKLVFSHRSGETEESILADLAFGFGADFLKCGITGKEREAKIKRLIEIEKGFGR
ncbi:MAG: hypothetical protein KKC19_03270 [Nanoarchaeota archaeon]|nr:hypothetical protein [Nanoarchaeota archaeon]